MWTGKGGKEKKEKEPAAAVAEKAAAAPAAAPAPAATHSRAVAVAKALTGGGKKKGAALSAMWSKAPPKKAKDSAPAAPGAAKAAEGKPKLTAAVDAEAALRLNGQVNTDVAVPFVLPMAKHLSGSGHAASTSLVTLAQLFVPKIFFCPEGREQQ